MNSYICMSRGRAKKKILDQQYIPVLLAPPLTVSNDRSLTDHNMLETLTTKRLYYHQCMTDQRCGQGNWLYYFCFRANILTYTNGITLFLSRCVLFHIPREPTSPLMAQNVMRSDNTDHYKQTLTFKAPREFHHFIYS